MQEIEELLVPLDGTAESMPALDVAGHLADLTGWPVSAMAVCSPYEDEWRERAWLADLGRRHDVSLSRVVVRFGDDVASEIVDEAQHRRSLVCLASHGRLALPEMVLGSTSGDIVRRTDGVLLIAGPACRPPSRLARLLVGVDGSLPSSRAVEAAAAFAARFGLAVSVVEVADLPGDPAPGSDALDRARACLDRAQVVCDVARLPGTHAARELVRHADAVGADLVVVGTHGRTGVRAVTMGSVANAVVRHADRPVLVVHRLESGADV
jgi:nucleotide-binding universal stress UspA family protein